MSAIGDIMTSFGTRLGNTLLPSAYLGDSGLTTDQIQAAQLAARRQFGIGLLSNIGSGRGFGPGLGQAFDMASGGGEQAMQRVVQNSQRKKLLENQQAQFDAEQQARSSQQGLAAAQYVAASQAPKADLVRFGQMIPALGNVLKSQGIDPNALSDDQARAIARQLSSTFGSQLGQGPAPTKFENVAPGGSIVGIGPTGVKPVYTSTEEKFAGEPQPMNIGGKPVMARVGSNGTVQVVPGASPYNKPGAGGADAGLDDPNTLSWRDAVLSGNATMQQVPAKYRTPVANLMSSAPAGAYSPLAARRFTLAANDLTKNFLALPQYQLTANGLPYLQRIDAALKTPGSVSDQDLLDSLTKLNTAGNAITDAQVKIITGGQSFSDLASVLANKFSSGGVLSDNQRKQIQKIAKGIFANYQNGYKPVYDAATYKLKASGIPQAFWGIPDLNDLSAQIDGGAYALEPPTAGAPPASAATVSITSDADYNKLPSGTRFVGPDGKVRRKP